jgi:hypothetical protein
MEGELGASRRRPTWITITVWVAMAFLAASVIGGMFLY